MRIDARKFLEDWLEKHKNNPYPTSFELLKLWKETGVEVDIIKTWFKNKRSRSQDIVKKSSHYFSIEEKKFLNSYFNNKNIHPGPLELAELSRLLNKDDKKIRSWFAKERFKMNQSK